mgnify:CR=1 FL=1
MTMTREQVKALVARLAGKTWYVTDSTGQRWADDAPEDAARALLAALDDLDAVKAERDKWHDLAAANGRAALDELAQVVAAEARAEAAEAANAALTARNEALERERDAARNAALGEAIEAMSNKVANWSEDEDLHDWIAPGKTMIAEVAAIHANAGEG